MIREQKKYTGKTTAKHKNKKNIKSINKIKTVKVTKQDKATTDMLKATVKLIQW